MVPSGIEALVGVTVIEIGAAGETVSIVCPETAPEVAVMVTNKAMELMGSYGYVRGYDVEKYWRDCKIVQLWEGGAQLGRFDVCRGYYDCNL